MTPSSRRRASSDFRRPASARSTASVCWPRTGGASRALPGVAWRRIGTPRTLTRPARACGSVTIIERTLRCSLSHTSGTLLIRPAGRPLTRAELSPRLAGEERRHGVEHRDLDLLAAARPGPREQRERHAVGRRHARDEVGDRGPDLHGRPVGEPGDVHDPRLGLHDEVVAGAVRLRPRLAEARDRAVDEPRVEPGERPVAKPELLHGPGPKVLEEDVALPDERPEDRLALRGLEVQGDALLVAVDGHEIRRLAAREGRPAPRVVALPRPFELDDLSAHVAQHHRAEGPGEDAGEIQDADTGEWLVSSRHVLFLSRLVWRGSG